MTKKKEPKPQEPKLKERPPAIGIAGLVLFNIKSREHRAMFEWHGFTVFVVARAWGAGIDTKTQCAYIAVCAGVAYCSPKEEKVNPRGGFNRAFQRMTTPNKVFDLQIPFGHTLEKGFKKVMRNADVKWLLGNRVPDRLIEKIKGLKPWSIQTKLVD